jgi:2-C-methyl-D-erythritol 4-phosphate cytidylyltransferase
MAVNYTALIYADGQPLLKEKVGGKSVLSHSLDLFDADEQCTQVLLVAGKLVRDWVAADPLTFTSMKMKTVAAEGSRTEALATAAAQASEPLLVVHDAARPNAKEELLQSVLRYAKDGMGCVPAYALPGAAVYLSEITEDTSSNGNGDDDGGSFLGPASDVRLGHLMEHPGGGQLFSVQSPQAYMRADYLRAIEASGDELDSFGDDSELVLAGGLEVAAVPGRADNIMLAGRAELSILLKLMGGGTKKKKDRYGGLGW